MWRPVLAGDEAVRARALVDEIVAALPELRDGSLADGAAGLALLHAYRGDDEASLAALQLALEQVSVEPGLFSGATGIGFVLAHLEAGDDEAMAVFDAAAARDLDKVGWELTRGAVGLGVYARERGDRALVARVVARLEAVAADGWRAVDRDLSRYDDLGLAHGVAGALAFLARAGASTDSALAWLRARERPEGFPMTLERGGAALTGHVDGWCYGDLSVAIALLAAGERDAARATAHRSVRRTDATVEGGVCHGTAGRALIFQRLGLALADELLLDAARAEYAKVVAVAEPDWLGGNIGIALALLAAVDDREPAWARALLLF